MVQWFHHQIGWLLRSCPTSKQPTLPWAVSVGISNYPSMHSKAVEVKKNKGTVRQSFAMVSIERVRHFGNILSHWNTLKLSQLPSRFHWPGRAPFFFQRLWTHGPSSPVPWPAQLCQLSDKLSAGECFNLSSSILHHLAPSCTSFHPLSASDCTALLSALCNALARIHLIHFVSVYDCVTLLWMRLFAFACRIALHLVVLHGFMQHCTEHNRFATSHLKMLHCILLDRKALHWPFCLLDYVGICWITLDCHATQCYALHCTTCDCWTHCMTFMTWPTLLCHPELSFLCKTCAHRVT